LGTANNDDLSQEITEFEEISNTREIFRKISHSLQKPKNTFKKLFKELEQEQLIINHSLAKECKKHNIDPQMIKLILITQDSEYGRSSIIYNQNLPRVSNYSNQYKKFIKLKNKKLNDLKSTIISDHSYLHATDEEYKNVEEKIVIPGRIKLVNIASSAASKKDEYFKTLTKMLEFHEEIINHWKDQGRSNWIRKLEDLRKKYVKLSLKAFKIPIGVEF
jgi:hypothetical protein